MEPFFTLRPACAQLDIDMNDIIPLEESSNDDGENVLTIPDDVFTVDDTMDIIEDANDILIGLERYRYPSMC